MRVYIKDIFKSPAGYLGKSLCVCGWAKTVRDNKSFGFMDLNDGSFFKNLQVVFDNNLDNFESVCKLNVGSSVTIEGVLTESPGAKQPFELKAASVTVEGASAADYPLQKKKHSFEYLRTIAHLRPRTNTFMAVFRIRSLICFAIHKFFNDRNFVYVHTPIISVSDCEGAGEMFQVTTLDMDKPPRLKSGEIDYGRDFFDKKAYMTVSGQLNVEAFCMAFADVYTFGPTFRAENSNTPRHVAEFWMIEPEIAFADLNDDMNLCEDMVKYIIAYVLENAPEEMAFLNQFIDGTLIERLTAVVNSEFGRVTYTEAIDIMQKSGVNFEYPVSWGMDIQTEHERYLSETAFKRPVFVTDYPKGIKAFYMRGNDDGKTVAAMDLLIPEIGELVGGSQREERLDVLEARIDEMGLEREPYWWYLDLRRYGGVKHAGFGLGLERMVRYVTGMANIRDVSPFPRTVGSADF